MRSAILLIAPWAVIVTYYVTALRHKRVLRDKSGELYSLVGINTTPDSADVATPRLLNQGIQTTAAGLHPAEGTDTTDHYSRQIERTAAAAVRDSLAYACATHLEDLARWGVSAATADSAITNTETKLGAAYPDTILAELAAAAKTSAALLGSRDILDDAHVERGVSSDDVAASLTLLVFFQLKRALTSGGFSRPDIEAGAAGFARSLRSCLSNAGDFVL